MSGLKTVTIGSLGNVVTGSTPPKKDKDNYGNYALWIKPTDINENEKYTRFTEEMFSKKSAEQCKSRIVPKDSICVPCIGTIGTKLTMTPCDCFVNQSINAIVPNEYFDNHYVYYLLRNFLQSLKSHNKGTASGREFIAKTAFEEIEIKVFEDKQIQQKIGFILSAYDNLIDNYRRQIKLLEEAAQRLYKEWFVDLHFPGYEHTKIVDGVPKGWKKSNVGSLCTLRKSLVSTDKLPTDCAYIGLEHMPRIDFCLSKWGKVDSIASSKYRYKEDDIIFGKIRPYFHKVGFAINEGVVSSDSFVMTANKGYWAILLMTVFDKAFVGYTYQTCKEGAKMPRADWKYMKAYKVLIPSESIRMQFEDYVWNISRLIKSIALQNNVLTEARDRLLPRLMSGEIKV